jgi:hypothetical protein
VAAATPVRLAAAIGSAYDLKVTEEMKRRGEPKGIHSAHRERTNQAYAIQARRRGISHKVLRTMLSGGGLRRAVVLTEILGRPRAEQEFAAPGSTSGTN